ncbi:MAG: type II toxin-antitoxin system RelE/ParE family toxin [Nitrospinae bacterium]|nr:type II toxin-antitoxin system RelE/ParE family toxin [Nitrospinota bacterium]
MRIGDYRVIYEIDEPRKIVRIMIVKHRKDAYR